MSTTASLALAFDVLARDKASDTFDKVGNKADGLGSKLGNVGKIAGAALGGVAVAAVAGFGAALFQGVKDAVSYETITNKLAATLKATGNAAGTSVDDMKKLAGQLESLSGVDEELILNSQNVLATFKNISNNGPGSTFDEATKAALNLSTTMNGDLQGASVLVGKALNDPIKGLTALGRAGVGFTESQKEAIKAMVATGDVAGAQKVILGELEGQFGGAAEAAGKGFAGDLARLQDAFSDAFRDVGAKILPYLADLASWLGDKLPGAIDTVFGAFGRIGEQVSLFWNALRSGEDEGTPIERFALGLRDNLLPAFQNVVSFVRDSALPALQTFGAWIVDSLWPAVQRIVEAVGGWGDALKIVGAVVAVAVAPLAALAAGVIYAYTQFDGFRAVVDAVVSWFSGTAIPAVLGATDFMVEKFRDLKAWVDRIWPDIQEAIGHVMRAVKEIIGVAVDAISAIWRAWGDDLLTIAKGAFEFLRETVDNALQVVRGLIQTVMALINGDWGKAWDGIKSILAGVWDQVTNIIDTAITTVGAVIGGGLSMLSEVWSGAWNGLKGAVSAAIGGVVDTVKALPGQIVSALGNVGGLLVGVGKDLVEGFIRGIGSMAGSIVSTLRRTITDKVPGFIKDALGISSPSKVLAKLGADTAKGYALGILGQIPGVQKAASAMTGAMTGTLGERYGAALSGLASGDVLSGQSAAEWSGNFAKQLTNLIGVFRSGDDVANGAAEVIDNMFGNTGKLIPVIAGSTEQLANMGRVMASGTDIANGLAEIIDSMFGNTGQLVGLVNDTVAGEGLTSVIRRMFTDSGVQIATHAESADERIARIRGEVMAGRSLNSVQASLDWIQRAGLAGTGGYTGGVHIENLNVSSSDDATATARATVLALQMAH